MRVPHGGRTTVASLIMVVNLLMMLPAHARESHGRDFSPPQAAVNSLAKGTWEMSVMSGYTYTYRRTDAHVTKLQGVPMILGGGIVATDPIGASWYRGQLTVGGELLVTQYVESLSTYLVALTPTVKYTFLAFDGLHPYVEAGAGVLWTDLGDRIPEKGSQFNFNLQVGAGLSYFVTPTTSINLSYRLQHISNAGTAHPNHGIDAGVALVGVSRFF
jgi:opacity protein-like surface antigen